MNGYLEYGDPAEKKKQKCAKLHRIDFVVGFLFGVAVGILIATLMI